MKVEIQEQHSLSKPSPKASIPDEENEVNYTSLRKCSKKKHLSKHKSTSSTLASDSSQHRISVMQDLLSASSSKKARRNLIFDEIHLQCPELEEEEEEDQEEQEDFNQSSQQEQKPKCSQSEETQDINTVKINKTPPQAVTYKIEEFKLLDQSKYESNSEFSNCNQLQSDTNNMNVLNYSQNASNVTTMLPNPCGSVVDMSQNFMACFSQIEGNNQSNSEQQVPQNHTVMDSNETRTSRNTDQAVIPTNENDHIIMPDENNNNIPSRRVGGLPPRQKRQAFGDITETYRSLQGTKEITSEEQNHHQIAAAESQELQNQGTTKEIIQGIDATMRNNNNSSNSSNKLEEEEEEEMQEVERLLFNPVDDVNFIEDDPARFKMDEYSRNDDYGQFLNQENSLPFHDHFFISEQENNSQNHSEKERTQNETNNNNNNTNSNQVSQQNSSQPVFLPPHETDSFPAPNVDTPQQALTMEEQLAGFEQDDMFGFDEEDKQVLEQTEEFFIINAESLLNYRSTFTNFPQKRAILLDWMQEVSSSLSFKRETYQQSVSIMDRFFQQVPLIPKNKIQLVGATALVLAHKMEEVHIWKIEDFIMACNYGFTREQFLEMEQHIWQTLQYRLSCTPGYFWMNQLMLEWDVFSEQFEQLFENDVIFFRKNTQESFRMFSSVCQYLDSVLLNISSYNYSWNSLVASFMYWALYQSIDIANHPVRLSYLDQIFEQFIANTLRIPSFQHMNLQLNFTSHYLNLNINTSIPTCKKEFDPHSQNSNSSQGNSHYQSYENVCSQQIYNQDCLRLFSSA